MSTTNADTWCYARAVQVHNSSCEEVNHNLCQQEKDKKNHIWEGRERGGEKLKNTLKDEITVGMAMQIP